MIHAENSQRLNISAIWNLLFRQLCLSRWDDIWGNSVCVTCFDVVSRKWHFFSFFCGGGGGGGSTLDFTDFDCMDKNQEDFSTYLLHSTEEKVIQVWKEVGMLVGTLESIFKMNLLRNFLFVLLKTFSFLCVWDKEDEFDRCAGQEWIYGRSIIWHLQTVMTSDKEMKDEDYEKEWQKDW